MLDKATQKKLEAAVQSQVHLDKMFTACEIIDGIRKYQTVPSSYAEMRDYIHDLFYAGWLGVGYVRSSVEFDSGGSLGTVSSFVYHPKWKNANDYRSHRTVAPATPNTTPPRAAYVSYSTANTAASAPSNAQTTAGTSVTGLTDWQSFWSIKATSAAPVTVKATDSNGNSVQHTCTNTTIIDPLKGPKTLGGKKPQDATPSDTIYSFDTKGRVVLGSNYTSRFAAPGDTVYGIRERKRLTLVKEADALRSAVIIFTLDSGGNLRIPVSILEEVGLKLPKINVDVDDDDTIFITQSK